MTLPGWLRAALPQDTANTWEAIAPLVPQAAYLVGGTAIAVHLRHRPSRDLDFFYHDSAVDLEALADTLLATGRFAVRQRSGGTLNGLFSRTLVQLLHADEERPQRLLVEPEDTAGLRVATLPDLVATKLKVIAQRGELRDYFDLMCIEEQAGLTVEEGLGYFIARFGPHDPANQIMAIIRALGYLDDVDEDDLLPASKAEIALYWRHRQPEVLKSAGWLTRGGGLPPPPPSS